ncbi:aldo/keto reductase [Actinomadura logoneensis]|uniref:Aldo/keto reductase n=1 Tax=Actinomadura logoneensis TaxID=2293572 RepID=A0A372JK41_9ACTN|nr:aldo/keto reductase [Actinomadura logoneensis]RFU40214.1 aldo/keto reductase [Actinomadura logoneensis]
MALLGLGTYRCRDVSAAAQAAIAAGLPLIDTAPVYAHGTAQTHLGRHLINHSQVRVSSKVGHMTRSQAAAARVAGVVTVQQAERGHCLTPDYIDHQLAQNLAELRRSRLDLLYLHNPEHDIHTDRQHLMHQIRDAFEACERAAHQGRITGYGIATWSGFSSSAFTVPELLAAARQAAGGPDHHLAAIQLPVNLVQLAPLSQSLKGGGPVAQASHAGLEVWASAPLNGGELTTLVSQELAELIGPGLSPSGAALTVVASTPGITGALLSASTTAHLQDALVTFQRPPLQPEHLREICRVLRT